ncbi:MAG: PKD domain-containing protein [Bacteroidia bacterium]
MKPLSFLTILLIASFNLLQAQTQDPLFTVSDSSICQGGMVSFTNLYPNMYGYTYHWQFGDGQSDSSHVHTAHTYSAADTFPASLTLSGDSFIYVMKSFHYSYLKQSLWYQFPFDVNVDPYITVNGQQSNQHNFNTNEGSSNVGGSHPNYTQYFNRKLGLQTYTIKVYDYDATGADDLIGSFTITIPGGSGSFSNSNMTVSWTIDSIPVGPYTKNIISEAGPAYPVISGPDTICNGDTLVLSTPADPGINYQWFLNGNPISGANQAVLTTVGVGATYTVQATDPNGGCQPVSDPHPVVISWTPEPTVTTYQETICDGDSIAIAAYGSWSAYPKQWYKDGVPIPGATSAQLIVSDSGSYQVEITNLGCIGYSTPTIIEIVQDTTLTLIPFGNQILCQGDTMILEATSQTGAIYRWHKNGLFIPGSEGPNKEQYFATEAGDYYVSWTSPCGDDTSLLLSITLNPSPQAPIISGPTGPHCDGNSILLSFQPDSGVFYQWQKDGVNIPGATNTSLTVSQSGNYQVVATNSAFCEANSSNFPVVFSANPANPNLSINGAPPFCEGQPVVLSSSAQSGLTHQWYHNGSPIQGAIQATYLASSPGLYHLLVSNASQCSSLSDTVQLDMLPAPAVPVVEALGGIDHICEGDTAWLMTNADPGLTYQWFVNQQLISSANGALLGVTESGSIQVQVENADGCQSISAPYSVEVSPCLNL